MKNKLLTKLLGIVLAVSLFLTGISIVNAEVTPVQFFKRVGTAVNFIASTWEFGSSTNRIAKIYATAIDATTITGGGTVSSATAPLSLSSGTLSITQSSGSTNGYLSLTDWTTFNGKLSPTGNGSGLTGLTKTQVGLGSVENTALSTWAGTSNITTLGTIATGSWNATAIPWNKVSKSGAVAGDVGAEPTLTKGNLTETTSSVLTISSGTGAVIGTGTTIAVSQADTDTSGYLSFTDWNTFNGKQNALGFTPVSNATTVNGYALSSNVSLALDDISNVNAPTPTDGYSLVYEAGSWVPKDTSTVSVGAGVNTYLDDTTTIDDYGGLLRTPNTAIAEQTDSGTANNSTVFVEGYLYNQSENRTKWDGGIWKFNTWCYVDSAVGVSEIIIGVYNVQYTAGTVAITGSGTSRTATVSGGTPFVAGDANANQILATYVQTAGGTFWITGYTSNTEVTITTPSGYVNESGASYSLHRYKFQVSTGEINNTTLSLVSSTSAQGDIALSALTDTIAYRYYAKTTRTSDVVISFTHNGASHYSYVETPLQQRHDELAGLNLTGSNYMHLSSAEKTVATQSASGSVNGYLSSADWTTFNGKQAGSSNLTSVAGLTYASTSFVKMTNTNTFALDTKTYLSTSASEFSALSEKTGLTANDIFIIEDSADTNAKKKVLWSNVLPSASTSVAGKVELAEIAEVNTGTSTTLAVTPDALAGSYAGTKTAILKAFADDASLATGDGKMYFTVPASMGGMNLVDVDCHVYTVSSSGTPTFAVYNLTDSHDMLSTNVTVDASEVDSTTATTPPVIDTSYDDVVEADVVRIDVDVAGTGTKGGECRLLFRLP